MKMYRYSIQALATTEHRIGNFIEIILSYDANFLGGLPITKNSHELDYS